ncbi:MAG: hypothetical protein HZB92_00900 [Euryarchaeota archaeon]|nr:hypothetical protein [Euryarchaeota archaeon]
MIDFVSPDKMDDVVRAGETEPDGIRDPNDPWDFPQQSWMSIRVILGAFFMVNLAMVFTYSFIFYPPWYFYIIHLIVALIIGIILFLQLLKRVDRQERNRPQSSEEE